VCVDIEFANREKWRFDKGIGGGMVYIIFYYQKGGKIKKINKLTNEKYII